MFSQPKCTELDRVRPHAVRLRSLVTRYTSASALPCSRQRPPAAPCLERFDSPISPNTTYPPSHSSPNNRLSAMGAYQGYREVLLSVEAIIYPRGHAITASPRNVARIAWNPVALLAAATAPHAIELSRKGMIVSSMLKATTTD